MKKSASRSDRHKTSLYRAGKKTDGLTKLSVEVALRLIMHYFNKLGYSRYNTLFTQHRKIGVKRKEVSSLQAIIVTFLIWRVSDRQPRERMAYFYSLRS